MIWLSLEGKKFEGVLEFASHVFSLRCFLECLQSGGVSDNAGEAKTPRSSGHGIDNAADHLAKVNIMNFLTITIMNFPSMTIVQVI